MLGFDLKREPVKGKFARAIREQMGRIHNGRLTEKEKKIILEEKKDAKKALVEWK